MRLEPRGHDVLGIRAANPGPFTLQGTNSWIVGRDPAWLIDPGPARAEHLESLAQEIDARHGLGGIALTHDHPDHAEAAPELARRAGGVPVTLPRGGERAGPFEAIATPGHSADHVSLLLGRVCFSGDTVLGRGSVFIAADGGGLGPYLNGLRRLRELDLEALCPGHGPVVQDPGAKLDEYIEHRLERERKLVAALDQGLREPDDLLDAAWDDVDWSLSPYLRWAAGQTLEAHLQKLRAEGRV